MSLISSSDSSVSQKSLLDKVGQSWKVVGDGDSPDSNDGFCHNLKTTELLVNNTDPITSLIYTEQRLFGLCPQHEDFILAQCNRCGLLIKPQGFRQHHSYRHVPVNRTVSSPPLTSPVSPLPPDLVLSSPQSLADDDPELSICHEARPSTSSANLFALLAKAVPGKSNRRQKSSQRNLDTPTPPDSGRNSRITMRITRGTEGCWKAYAEDEQEEDKAAFDNANNVKRTKEKEGKRRKRPKERAPSAGISSSPSSESKVEPKREMTKNKSMSALSDIAAKSTLPCAQILDRSLSNPADIRTEVTALRTLTDSLQTTDADTPSSCHLKSNGYQISMYSGRAISSSLYAFGSDTRNERFRQQLLASQTGEADIDSRLRRLRSAIEEHSKAVCAPKEPKPKGVRATVTSDVPIGSNKELSSVDRPGSSTPPMFGLTPSESSATPPYVSDSTTPTINVSNVSSINHCRDVIPPYVPTSLLHGHRHSSAQSHPHRDGSARVHSHWSDGPPSKRHRASGGTGFPAILSRGRGRAAPSQESLSGRPGAIVNITQLRTCPPAPNAHTTVHHHPQAQRLHRPPRDLPNRAAVYSARPQHSQTLQRHRPQYRQEPNRTLVNGYRMSSPRNHSIPQPLAPPPSYSSSASVSHMNPRHPSLARDAPPAFMPPGLDRRRTFEQSEPGRVQSRHGTGPQASPKPLCSNTLPVPPPLMRHSSVPQPTQIWSVPAHAQQWHQPPPAQPKRQPPPQQQFCNSSNNSAQSRSRRFRYD